MSPEPASTLARSAVLARRWALLLGAAALFADLLGCSDDRLAAGGGTAAGGVAGAAGGGGSGGGGGSAGRQPGLECAPSAGSAVLETVAEQAGGRLSLARPPGGDDASRIRFLELGGTPGELGYQHGFLLADEIAAVILDRYSCPEIDAKVLAWAGDLHARLPAEFREEIDGMRQGLLARGKSVDLARLTLHATQPTMHPAIFPWFACPWSSPASPGGSFAYAVWGGHTDAQRSLMIGSPDWGAVPPALTQARVIISVRPSPGHRHVFLGVAGTIGLTGFNETGVALAGTAGQRCKTAATPMPSNTLPIPAGYMPLFVGARYALTHLSGADPQLFDRFESEVLTQSPQDGFIVHLAAPGRSRLWEPGATASPGFPGNSRRDPGEWDDGQIIPVSIVGGVVLTQYGWYDPASLSYQVEFSDSAGAPYAGMAVVEGKPVKWRAWQLGRALVLPPDPTSAARFQAWYQGLWQGKVLDVPTVVRSGDWLVPSHVVSTKPDKSGGFWTNGTDSGTWTRQGDEFSIQGADGGSVCSGPIYDFGVGVTGHCNVGTEDLEWLAWTYQLSAGASERLDGMNLSVLPGVKPWAAAKVEWPVDFTPHSRTHLVVEALGPPATMLRLDALYAALRNAYLAMGGQDAPFGVGAYDLSCKDALFTVSRYAGGTFVGGLNPQLIPVRLTREELFGL